jgi:putative Holliday junction resolvase
LASLSRGTPQSDARWFADLVAREEVVGFVVGLPVGSRGGETQKSREAREFGQWLAQSTGLPVTYFDERYTTVEADAILSAAELTSKRRKKRRDMLAAQILLTAFLESSTPGEQPEALED